MNGKRLTFLLVLALSQVSLGPLSLAGFVLVGFHSVLGFFFATAFHSGSSPAFSTFKPAFI